MKTKVVLLVPAEGAWNNGKEVPRDTENESLNNWEMLLSLTLLLLVSPIRNYISRPGVVVGSVFAVWAWSEV